LTKTSFVKLPKPFLCSVITEETPENSINAIRISEYEGAEAFLYDLRELNVKYHNKEDLSKIFSITDKPIMVYYYRRWEHIPAVNDEERAKAYLTAIEAGASAVDMMGDLFDPCPMEISRKIDIIEKQRKLMKDIRERGGEVMISCHTLVRMSTEEILSQVREVVNTREPDMVKIVPRVETEDELLEAFRSTATLKRELKIPFIHIAMGTYNRIHRIVGPMLGSSLCFCVPYYNKDVTLEQPLLRATRKIFDNWVWRAIEKEEGDLHDQSANSRRR
jgi:3-dehydroquinate dehydratase